MMTNFAAISLIYTLPRSWRMEFFQKSNWDMSFSLVQTTLHKKIDTGINVYVAVQITTVKN